MTVPGRSKARNSNYVCETVRTFPDKKPSKFGGPFRPVNSLNNKPYFPRGYSKQGNRNRFGPLLLESTRGDNVAKSTNGDTQNEFQEPASKRRRMTMGSQPIRRATDDSDDLACDRHVVAVGGRALQSSPIKQVSGRSAEGYRRPVFQNIHSASAARHPRPRVVDLDDEDDDVQLSSPPAASLVGSKRQTSTSGQSIEDLTTSKIPDDLTRKRQRRIIRKEKRRAVSAGSDQLEDPVSQSQAPMVEDDLTSSGPIDSRSQQQEITKIREANRPLRNSGSPEIRISRFFEKAPEGSHEETDPILPQKAPESPVETTVVTEDRKATPDHPSRSKIAKQFSNGQNIHESKPRYRDRMTQQTVNTSAVAGEKIKAQTTNEKGKVKHDVQHEAEGDSEDELNGPVTRMDVAATEPSEQTHPTSPLLFSAREGSVTEPTAGEIKSKTFRRGSSSMLATKQQAAPPSKRNLQFFPVSRIHTRVVHRDGDGSDELAYNNEHKAFEIWIDGAPITRPSKSEVVRYTSNHFQTVWYCDDSLRIVCQGSRDDTSIGVLLFEFGDPKSKELFMRTLRDEFPQRKYSEIPRYAQLDIDFFQYTHRCDSSEIESLENRWATGLKRLQEARQPDEAHARTTQAKEASPVPALPKRPNRVGMSSHKLTPDTVNTGDDTQQPQSSAQQPANSGQRQTYVITEKQPTPTRASTRVRTKPTKAENQIAEQEVSIERFRLKHKIRPWEEPLTYPFVGQKRTTVNFEDLDRIDEGDLLNDNIVNFCLRKAEYEHEKDIADKVFFFNTYFFSTLTTTRAGKRGFNYDAVKRWTKKVDLFSLPYVVIPINSSFHWYLTIICNLQNLPRGDAPVEEPQQVVASDEEMQDGHDQDPSSSAPAGDMPSKQFKRMSLDDEDPMPSSKAEADFEIPDSDDERKKQAAYESALVNSQEELPKVEEVMTKKAKKKLAAPVRRWSPDQPLIITLDSLGAPHSQEVKLLKEYIVAEALDKRGLTIEAKQIQGITAKGIPEQTNLSDCGVFLIGYVEEFLKDPRRFVEKVCSKEMDRNNDFQDFEPKEKRNEIRDTLIELSTEQLKNKAEEKARKKEAKRKATEQAGGDAKRIASSPVKDPIEQPVEKTSSSPLKRPIEEPVKEPIEEPINRITSSPVKEAAEEPETSDGKVSDLSVSSPAKQSAIEMAIRGQTSVLEGIGEWL